MIEALVALVVGLGGILLGGGLKALETRWARNAEAEAVLSALVSEVESLYRLMNHRGFLANLVAERNQCRALVAAGDGAQMVQPSSLAMHHNYFALFEALADKVGLLKPYHADRIVRFYVLAKAASENLIADLPSMTASDHLDLLESDIALIRVLMVLGDEIAGFRTAQGPATVLGPLQVDPRLMSDDPAALNATSDSDNSPRNAHDLHAPSR